MIRIEKFERLLCEVAFFILSTITYGLLPMVKYTNNTQLKSPKGNPNKHVFHMPTSLTKDGAKHVSFARFEYINIGTGVEISFRKLGTLHSSAFSVDCCTIHKRLG